jgi:hypothetical protein
MIKLNKGTKEHIPVDIADRLESLTTLSGANPRFTTRLRYEATNVQTDIAATNIGMTAFCLIDTTLAGYVVGIYELFIKFDNLPEAPVLGPYEFEVTA